MEASFLYTLGMRTPSPALAAVTLALCVALTGTASAAGIAAQTDCQPLIGCAPAPEPVVVQPIIGFTDPTPVPTCCFVPLLGNTRYLYPDTGTHY